MSNYKKLRITGELIVVTGLHIGTSEGFAAIGATDSPVIKHPINRLPIIPASSLKGKMRSLLAKSYNEQIAKNPTQDNIKILRLFGSSQVEKGQKPNNARLLFRDLQFINHEELKADGISSLTEIKFENTIDRITAIAKPRQIERVIPTSKFQFEAIYNVEDEEEIFEDFEMIVNGMKLLEYDYLGGHGSRGYGQVKFENLKVTSVFGELAEDKLSEINHIISNNKW